MYFPYNAILPLLIFACSLQSCAYYFGNARVRKSNGTDVYIDLSAGTQFATSEDPKHWAKHAIVQDWANVNMDANWKKNGKTNSPRILLAKLALGREIDSVNAYLCSLKPWGTSGTDWLMNPNGDYDFSEIILVNILCLFGDDTTKLYPASARHLLGVMLIEKGAKPVTKTPNSLRLLKETENHILMKESVRYLRRHWLQKLGGKNDAKLAKETANLEKWLFKHLEEMLRYGFWEFNSIPYLGYTFVPLMTLEAHAPSERIRNEARKILDMANREYVAGTLNFKRVVPFRRQLHRHTWSDLSSDPHTAMMRTWYYQKKGISVSKELSPHSTHQSLMALLLPYRLPDKLVEEIDNKTVKPPQLTRIGHGWYATPEIHWKGTDWLLTGGGVQRSKVSQLVPRPIVLILNDSAYATDIKQCFHIQGPKKVGKKNNTGIYKGLAVGKSPVAIPENYKPDLKEDNWQLFSVLGKLADKILIYNEKDFGVLIFISDWKADNATLLAQIRKQNAVEKNLKKLIIMPNGDKIAYDLNAPKSKWVIKSENGKALNRKHDYWPRIE